MSFTECFGMLVSMEYPYQLVAFLDREPKVGERVYGGEDGWYAQIALKRRFRPVDIDEDQLITKVAEFCRSQVSLTITTKELIKPERMPVQVIEVEPSDEIINFHLGFIAHMGDHMLSRFPERDGSNYYPHITAEY